MLDVILLVSQLILFVLYFWQPGFVKNSVGDVAKVIGAIPMLFGAIMIIWALLLLQNGFSVFASPRREGELVTRGIFSYVRHPIYSGIILLAVGYSIFDVDMMKVLITLILVIFFHFKAGYEERQLMAKYPDYADYKLRTGKFLPTFLRYKVTKVKDEEPNTVDIKELPASEDDVPTTTWGDG